MIQRSLKSENRYSTLFLPEDPSFWVYSEPLSGWGHSPTPAHGAAAYRATGTARAPEAGLPSPRPASAPRKPALRRSPAPAPAAPAPVSPGHWLGRSPRFRGFSAAKLDPGHPQTALGRDGRCHSRAGVGSRRFIPAGKACGHGVRARARAGGAPGSAPVCCVTNLGLRTYRLLPIRPGGFDR